MEQPIRRTRPSGKGFLHNLLLLLISSVVALAIGEIFVRVAFDVNVFPRFHAEAVYGGYHLRTVRPNTTFWHASQDGRWKFETNNRGFRNTKDFGYEKAPGVYRVLVLGDSHTQGYEVGQEHTFSAILEKKLRLSGVNAEVINTGVSGFSTAEELLLLENEGIKYAPDAVVLAYFVNDLSDNVRANLFGLDESGVLIEKNRRYLPGVSAQEFVNTLPPLRWLSQHSHFYSLFVNKVWSFARSRLSNKTKNALFESAVAGGEDLDQYSYDLGLALILRLVDFCEQQGVDLFLLDIPTIKAKGQIGDSMPPAMIKAVSSLGSELVSGTELVQQYRGLIDLHRPHGHRHISEFTHLMIGTELGRRIDLKRAPGEAGG